VLGAALLTALLVLIQRADHRDAPTPHLVNLDFNLGEGLDGMASLAIIRRGWPSIPAILLTSSTDTVSRAEVLALGAAAYLVKPMRWEEYSELARTVMRLMTPNREPMVENVTAEMMDPRPPAG
jgi:DNA-binding response OmpR family regulator